MSKAKDKIRDALSLIDAIKTTLEEMAEGKSLSDLNFGFKIRKFDLTLNAAISLNPFEILVTLLEKFMTRDEMIEWLANKIVYELPIIELGVKTVLLAQLKGMVDCTMDPRIPEKYRRKLNPLPTSLAKFEEAKLSDNRGFIVGLDMIDCSGMLYYSPMNEIGQKYYFGTKKYFALQGVDGSDAHKFYSYGKAVKSANSLGFSVNEIVKKSEIDTLWEMARAEDFNAFMWFVTHKAKFPNPQRIIYDKNICTTVEEAQFKGSKPFAENGFCTVLGVINGNCSLKSAASQKPFIPGNTLIQMKNGSTSSILSLCIKSGSEKTAVKKNYGVEKAANGYTAGSVGGVSSSFSSEDDKLVEDPSIDDEGRKHIFSSVTLSSDNNIVVRNITYINEAIFYEIKYKDEYKKYDDGESFTLRTEYAIKGANAITSQPYDFVIEKACEKEHSEEDLNKFKKVKSYELSAYEEYAEAYKTATNRDLKNDTDRWYSLSEFERETAKKNINSTITNNTTNTSVSATTNPVNSVGKNTVPEVVIDGFSPEEYSFQMVPTSYDYRSANWYVNRKTYFDFLNPKKKTRRDYDKEFALCNLRYMGRTNDNESDGKGFVNLSGGMVKVTIMPKPFWHMPQLGDGSLIPVRILFDKNGKQSLNGKYTVAVNPIEPRVRYKTVVNKNGKPKERIDHYEYNVVDCEGNVVNYLRIKPNSTKYTLDYYDEFSLALSLHECYPGVTVYEYNYDFVMGMKLYDAKVVAERLIDSLCRINITGGFGTDNIKKSQTPYEMRISHIVTKVIEGMSSEVTDCFFKFSNDEYDSMLNEAEERRSNLYPFADAENKMSQVSESNIYDILSEYDDNASKEENKDVLSRAFTQAIGDVTKEVLPQDKYSISWGIVLDLIKIFATILVECILSPKVLLLIETNKQLMGPQSDMNFEEFLKSIMKIIVAVIKEIAEMIMAMILEEVLKKIAELLLRIAEVIIAEKLDAYLSVLRELIEKCLVIPNFSRQDLENKLDDINFAEIDEIGEVQTSEC